MKKARSSTDYLTRAAFQRVTGRSRAVVDQLLAEGLPHTTVGSGRGAEIRIPRDAAMAWLTGRRDKARSPSAARADPPPSALVLEHVDNPVHGGMVIGALLAIYSSTWWGKFAAEQEGVDPERAEMIGSVVSLMLVTLFEREFRGLGIEHFQQPDPDWLQPEQCWWQPGRGLCEGLEIPAARAP